MKKKLVIGISETCFTVSEAFALAIFRTSHSENVCEVQRVTNMDDCGEDKFDVLIGVGDVFDPLKNRFSHHGRQYSLQCLKILYGYTEPLSTAGLVYATYGRKLLKELNPDNNTSFADQKYNFRRIFEFFVEIVDRFTFKLPITYRTNEKEELLQYLTEYSVELDAALRASFSKNEKNLDFLSVVDIYSTKIEDKFNEMLNWFYNEYMRLMFELIKAMSYASNVHSSGHIALCDFDFGNVTFEEIVMRAVKYVSQKQHCQTPLLLVFKSKDCYRVECLCVSEENKSPEIFFPYDWPVKGEQIERVLGIFGVRHISDCGKHAIASTKEAALSLAVALIEFCEKTKILPVQRTLSESTTSNCNSLFSTSEYSSSDKMHDSARSCSSTSSSVQTDDQQKPEGEIVIVQKKKVRQSYTSGESLSTSSVGNSTNNLVDEQENREYNFEFELIPDDADDSTPKQVTATMSLASASLTALNESLRTKYPEFGSDYGLCHRSGVIPVLSSFVTESPRFWKLHYKDVCYARLPLRNRSDASTSVVTSDDELYETASSTKSVYDDADSTLRCSPQAELEVGSESRKSTNNAPKNRIIGVNFSNALRSLFGSEFLACAILLSEPKFEIANIKSDEQNKKFELSIGYPDSYCYCDGVNSFTRKNAVTMLSLDMMSCKDRLSCLGMVFASHGLKSIGNILVPKYGVDVCERKTLFKVFRRVYARLIRPIDQLVIAVQEGTSKEELNIEKATREAQVFVAAFGSGDPDPEAPEITDEEAQLQFNISLQLVRQFYRRFVIEVFRQLFPVD